MRRGRRRASTPGAAARPARRGPGGAGLRPSAAVGVRRARRPPPPAAVAEGRAAGDPTGIGRRSVGSSGDGGEPAGALASPWAEPLDYLLAALAARGLRAEPAGRRAGEAGAEVRSWTFRGHPRVRYGRLTLVRAPAAGVHALNLLAYPRAEVPAPLYGVDLVGLRGRALYGVDLHPLPGGGAAEAGAWLAGARALRGRYAAHAVAKTSKVYPDAAYFSDAMLLMKAEGEGPAAPRALLGGASGGDRPGGTGMGGMAALREYTAFYFDAVLAGAAPEAAGGARARARAAAQDGYDAWQRAHDPAGKVLAGLFGREWAAAYEREFLFRGDAAAGLHSESNG